MLNIFNYREIDKYIIASGDEKKEIIFLFIFFNIYKYQNIFLKY